VFLRAWAELWPDECGQTTTEYMLVIALLVFQAVLAYYLLAPALKDGFQGLAQRIMDNKP
jgi:Flp pilus assembly pilin Flp